ncbi:MAG: DUF3850 domain-containing protein [Desulfotalea sp.]
MFDQWLVDMLADIDVLYSYLNFVPGILIGMFLIWFAKREHKKSVISKFIKIYGRSPVCHTLKIESRFFEAILSGDKNYEIRHNDRCYKSGDSVLLYERKYGTGEYNWLPLTETLFADLFKHRKDCLSSKCVFPDPKTGKPYGERIRWMNKLCKKASVKLFGLHAIRHLTASILVENDVSLIDIQTILRHKSISTTEKYLHRLKSVRISIAFLDKKK